MTIFEWVRGGGVLANKRTSSTDGKEVVEGVERGEATERDETATYFLGKDESIPLLFNPGVGEEIRIEPRKFSN